MRPQARLIIGGASITDDNMLAMALYLPNQEMGCGSPHSDSLSPEVQKRADNYRPRPS